MMNTPNEAPLEELISSYAQGDLLPCAHALVASHLWLNHKSRQFASLLEQREVQKNFIPLQDDLAQQPLKSRELRLTRESRLGAIFSHKLDSVQTSAQLDSDASCTVIPKPLQRYLGNTVEQLAHKRKFLLWGVHTYSFTTEQGEDAAIYWIDAGVKMPHHTHEGSEITLVLKGSFSDETGVYRRGDVAIAGEELDHNPKADAVEGCICFAITDAPLRLTGRIGRMVQWVKDHTAH
jgi:putative transcriptional regulator